MESSEHRLDVVWLAFVKHHSHCCVGKYPSARKVEAGKPVKQFSYDIDDIMKVISKYWIIWWQVFKCWLYLKGEIVEISNCLSEEFSLLRTESMFMKRWETGRSQFGKWTQELGFSLQVSSIMGQTVIKLQLIVCEVIEPKKMGFNF